jgi:hypothetical protein
VTQGDALTAAITDQERVVEQLRASLDVALVTLDALRTADRLRPLKRCGRYRAPTFAERPPLPAFSEESWREMSLALDEKP